MVRNLNLSRSGLIASRLVRCGLALAAFTLLMVLPGRLVAQTTGTLTGVVKDTTGGIIPGAKVTLVNRESKAVRDTVSNGDAFFSFAAVQPGSYDVLIALKGFETYKVTGIEMHPGDSKTITTIALKIGAVETTITVNSNAAGVNLDSPEKSSLITAEDIKRLSTVGRDVTELVKFLPGFAISNGGSLNNDSTNNASQVVGFGTSTNNFAGNGSAPQQGGTAVISDGASVVDPADQSSSITNINVENVAEVKVQTSNFGADSAKGPIVLQAVSKSGGTDYHGSVYGYARNSALNANDWIDNYFGNPRAGTYNYYPGANIGGPVKIPHTNFNHSKKLAFWMGGEVYDQRNLYSNTATLSFVPTPQMLSGDLSTKSLETALNLPTGASAALCPTPYGTIGLNNFGACYQPGSNGSDVDVQGHSIVNGQIPVADFDPDVPAFTRFYPKPNRIPQSLGLAGSGIDCTSAVSVTQDLATGNLGLPAGSYCSDNINYINNIFYQNNGFQYHSRVDENFSDRTKLYITYNFEKVNAQAPVTNGYYAGTSQTIIPAPTASLSHAYANSTTLNLTRVFGPTLTNEFLLAGTLYYSPAQLQDRAKTLDENTGFSDPRYFQNGADQLPDIINFQGGVPSFSMGYNPPGVGAYLRKYSVNIADNVTKQLGRHSIKVGVYAEQAANNQFLLTNPQGQLAFSQYQECNTYVLDSPTATNETDLGNSVGNFLNGCGGFTQINKFVSGDMKYQTFDLYATDEWKATKKLTLTYGMRFEHLAPWVDVHGNGLAVWNPPAAHTFNANIDPNNPRTWPGISWHQTDPSVPLSGSPSTAFFYSPRVGLAYDVYGNGNTTVRGGFGEYRYHDSYFDSDAPLLTTIGVSTYNSPISCTLAQIGNQAGVTNKMLGAGLFVYQPGQACTGEIGGITPSSTAPPFSISALDPHDHNQPVTWNYNFTVDQKMPGNSLLELSYVGNQTHHSFTEGSSYTADLKNQNVIQLGGLFQPDPLTGVIYEPQQISSASLQDYRPYPNYTTVDVQNSIAYSNYNAFQGSWNKQRGSFIYGANFTWEKALGVRGTPYQTGQIADSIHIRNDYGYLAFNRNHIFNLTFSYQEGNKFHGNHILQHFLNQYEISGITGAQSGPDIAAYSPNFYLSGSYAYKPAGDTGQAIDVQYNQLTQLGTPDVDIQPNIVCSPKYHLQKVTNGVKHFVNPACFQPPAPGTNGTFHPPDIHGPMYFNSDLTVFRDIKLTEKQNLQFRMAAFNFLNHPLWQLYGGPATGLNLTYGQSLTAKDSKGQIIYPTTDAQARAGLIQTSNNFGSTPYKAALRIVELGFKYSF